MKNPFTPGAGHTPPYLAGRSEEQDEMRELLDQSLILNNLLLTGLRGVGKTVLLDSFKPIAIGEGWLWIGTDLSETASLDEERLVMRLLTDLSGVTSQLITGVETQTEIGFTGEPITVNRMLNYKALMAIYDETPGLASDGLKRVLETVWALVEPRGKKGIVFAYDEAQHLIDHKAKEHFPLSLLLEVFQSIQRKGVPFMLVLTGLPTLFSNLVDARTYSERMFRVRFLDRLSKEASRKAIVEPTTKSSVRFTDDSVETIVKLSAGYPHFIQFIAREFFELFIQRIEHGEPPSVPVDEVTQKLDADFFAARWAKATDRQMQLLYTAATLETAGGEFTLSELVKKSKQILATPFKSSNANRMLMALSEKSLIYKNRHGKYSFAVPLLYEFILRQNPPEGLVYSLFDQRA